MDFKATAFYFVLALIFSCTTNTIKIENENQGQLKQSVSLIIKDTKKIYLDAQTAPNAEYSQLFKDTTGAIHFTFLNNFTNSIYFYNYETLAFEKKITWSKDGPNSISGLTGYFIKSLDSIYLYNKSKIEILQSNDKGKIIHKISLLNNMTDSRNWALKYPQYDLQTVKPLLGNDHELLLTGFFFGTLPKNIIPDFKFTAKIDYKTNKLTFSNRYPSLLYGFGYNWEGDLFTEVYSDILPGGNRIILSFPVSHDLYIANLDKNEYKRVYGGSNFAGTIQSMNKLPRKSSKEEILSHISQLDEYTAIKYDKFRRVYYRFLLKAMPADNVKNDWKKKSIAVIMMDDQFRYLGETVIGTGNEWNWQNSFVTKEGLNIESIDKQMDESYLTLKIFTLKKI